MSDIKKYLQILSEDGPGAKWRGASSEDISNAIMYRIESQHPDLMSKFGDEVVYNAIMDIASFHEGTEELGSSDISGMVRDVIRNCESVTESKQPSMKMLIEGIDSIVGSNPDQKPGDQVRGTDKITAPKSKNKFLGAVHRDDDEHPFKDRLVGEGEDQIDEYGADTFHPEDDHVPQLRRTQQSNPLANKQTAQASGDDDLDFTNPFSQQSAQPANPFGKLSPAAQRLAAQRAASKGKTLMQSKDNDEDLVESLKAAFEDYVKNNAEPEEKKERVTITYKDGHKQTKSVTKTEKQAYETSKSVSKVEKATDSKSRIDDVKEGKSENRELWDRIKSRGTVPSIDRERYTDMSGQGLEGPFRQKNGQVLYYDSKEGRYYNRDSDMYVDQSDLDAMNESDPDIPMDVHLANKERDRQATRDKFSRDSAGKRKQAADDAAVSFYKNNGHSSNMSKPLRMPNGQILHHDPKAGAYYDQDSKKHISYEEYASMNEGDTSAAKYAKLKGLVEKARSLKEAPLDQTVAPAPGQQPLPGQQPVQGATPIAGQPKNTSQQQPVPAGQQTAAPAPGQPMPPAAGQPGGAPVATPGAPPQPVPGNANAATTPMQNLSKTVSDLAANPAAAKQAALKLANVAK